MLNYRLKSVVCHQTDIQNQRKAKICTKKRFAHHEIMTQNESKTNPQEGKTNPTNDAQARAAAIQMEAIMLFNADRRFTITE